MTNAKKLRAYYRIGKTKDGRVVERIAGYTPPAPRTKMQNPYNPERFIWVSEGQIINWGKIERKTRRGIYQSIYK